MSKTGGLLGFVTVVHWEKMQWFMRGITPTDLDGMNGDIGPYMTEMGGFAFFEFKHESAHYDPQSGQIKALERLARHRLTDSDIFVWVVHDAVPFGEMSHVLPENIVRWAMYECGAAYQCRERGVGAGTLEEAVGRWQRTTRL